MPKFIRRLFFPPRCPVCDRALDPRFPPVCSSCEKRIEYVVEPRCRICGAPIREEEEEMCISCSNTSHVFEQGRAAFIYKDPIRGSMYRFKYSNRQQYASFYAKCFTKANGKWIDHIRPDIIAPIPLHKKRLRVRGYNQAALFARELGKETGICVCEDLLIRVKKTIPQKQLSLAQRKNNLKKAFKSTGYEVQSKNILLTDDIYTTGSTMDEAASVLLRDGAAAVFAACICIGEN